MEGHATRDGQSQPPEVVDGSGYESGHLNIDAQPADYRGRPAHLTGDENMAWVLVLNEMRGRCEDMRPVARAETKEALWAFLERERVEPYKDDGSHTIVHNTDFVAQMVGGDVVEQIPQYRWNKTFRKGGPLEWFNPPYGDSPENFVYVGSREEWAQRGRDKYDRDIGSLPSV